MIIDELYERVKKNGAVCVGLDTDRSYIPSSLKSECNTVSEEIFFFNKKIIDYTKDIAACYKLQIAYYEMCGLEGMKAYRDTLLYLKKEKLISIADVKRGDIGKTMDAYAKAHFSGDFEVDFITVNPYMGFDTLEPFFPYLKSGKKGVFVLLKTSNPGSSDIEAQDLGDRKVFDIVGDKLSETGEMFMGECGYSSLGAVVGATYPEELGVFRKKYPKMFFLVPGYGAQGAGADEVKLAFNSGNGAVINNSRGIITAYKDSGEEFFDAARNAVLKMNKDISATL